MSKKKSKKIITIEMPDSFEMYKKVRKTPIPTTQQHSPKKGKGSYKRKSKHPKKESSYA